MLVMLILCLMVCKIFHRNWWYTSLATAMFNNLGRSFGLFLFNWYFLYDSRLQTSKMSVMIKNYWRVTLLWQIFWPLQELFLFAVCALVLWLEPFAFLIWFLGWFVLWIGLLGLWKLLTSRLLATITIILPLCKSSSEK